MANEAGLAVLRECKRDDCDYKVPNVDLLMAMAIHPASGDGVGGGGGGGKSNAPIPQLDENISEVLWTSWRNRFERWQLSCNISDKAVENRIFKAIPNALADQIRVNLAGNEIRQCSWPISRKLS